MKTKLILGLSIWFIFFSSFFVCVFFNVSLQDYNDEKLFLHEPSRDILPLLVVAFLVVFPFGLAMLPTEGEK